MNNLPKYYIVESRVMPEVFQRVMEVKRLLESGEASNVNVATLQAGLSRSAYYKYKDAVRPFQDMLHGRIVTFQVVLRDEPGALSSILTIFAHSGGNILTINQSIPSNGCALVSASVETSEMTQTVEELLAALTELQSVINCQILAG